MNIEKERSLKEVWEERYRSEKDLIYGEEPNKYFRQEISKLESGKLLLVGEGEGRNAIYASKKGWNVDAVDYCEAAREKAFKFARKNNVIFSYIIEDLKDFNPDTEKYDAAALIFVHLHLMEREDVFKKIYNALKYGGVFVLEVFDKEQIGKSSGGPKSLDALYSLDEIVELCIDYDFEYFAKEIILLDEGKYHQGEASVIRFTGVKKVLKNK